MVGVTIAVLTGCSVFGQPGVDIAPYSVIENEGKMEVRHYEELLLVSTPISDDGEDQNAAFRRLFNYISGANRNQSKIPMTAPVVTGEASESGEKIAMTAPVFMGREESVGSRVMSFVLPGEFSMDTVPVPNNPDVFLSKTSDLTVAVIRFNGLLWDRNIRTNREKLETWIAGRDFRVVGAVKTAGYNPPWTLPSLRRNEILVPIDIQ